MMFFCGLDSRTLTSSDQGMKKWQYADTLREAGIWWDELTLMEEWSHSILQSQCVCHIQFNKEAELLYIGKWRGEVIICSLTRRKARLISAGGVFVWEQSSGCEHLGKGENYSDISAHTDIFDIFVPEEVFAILLSLTWGEFATPMGPYY